MADDDKKTPAGGGEGQDIRPVSITDEMKRSYLDYAMSVIVSPRAARLPRRPQARASAHPLLDERERLLPGQALRKSARVVGDVIGKYHPHGDQSIYDALVRMAQEFSMRLPLVDGQGNFGSVDGDPAGGHAIHRGAPRASPPWRLLEDLDKDTVDFQPNYDGSEREPTVLPARFPNLLVNGAGGIAVGMATNIPPHNLGEVIDGLRGLHRQPRHHDRGADGARAGAGLPDRRLDPRPRRHPRRLQYRAAARSSCARRPTIETIRKDREAIIVTEIPYQMNKATLIEKIAELVRDKRVEGISDLRDESDRDGMRIVIEIKRDAMADVVLNQLWRYTALQSSFGANMVALNGGRPQILNLKEFVARLRRIPRGGRQPPHALPARQGARPRPCAGGPRHRRRQYRRGHPHHPLLAGRQRGARGLDGAGLAGEGRRAADRADRRPAPPCGGGRHLSPVRGAGARDP